MITGAIIVAIATFVGIFVFKPAYDSMSEE